TARETNTNRTASGRAASARTSPRARRWPRVDAPRPATCAASTRSLAVRSPIDRAQVAEPWDPHLWTATMKTFAFEAVGRVVVWHGTSSAPSDAEWQVYVAAIKAHVATHRYPCSFVWTGGAGPSAVQRTQLTAVVPPETPVAIIIRNPI